MTVEPYCVRSLMLKVTVARFSKGFTREAGGEFNACSDAFKPAIKRKANFAARYNCSCITMPVLYYPASDFKTSFLATSRYLYKHTHAMQLYNDGSNYMKQQR